MNRALQGGCQVPIAGFAVIDGAGELWLRGLVGSNDGTRTVRAEARGPRAEAERIGAGLGATLLAQGADAILRELWAAG